ncbi:MAG: hypothetical protein AAF663_04885, partial [Planctomycetota bacterium]
MSIVEVSTSEQSDAVRDEPVNDVVVPQRVEFEAPPTNWWGKLMRWGERKFSLWSTKDNLGHRVCSW